MTKTQQHRSIVRKPLLQLRNPTVCITILLSAAGLWNIDNLYRSTPIYSPLKLHACKTENSFEPTVADVVLDFDAIRNFEGARNEFKQFTTPKYQGHFMNKPGREHYALLSYLTATYGDCRHVTDIGTRYVASSLALGSNRRSPVWTFDLPKSKERRAAFQGQSEEEWQSQVKAAGVSITFHNLNLLNVTEENFRMYMGSWLVVLDTHHLPYTVPFEVQWFQRMMDIKFKGIIVLDDIHVNKEMRQWWKDLCDNADQYGYKTYDLTPVGHHSGTGLVDFSGRVRLVADKQIANA